MNSNLAPILVFCGAILATPALVIAGQAAEQDTAAAIRAFESNLLPLVVEKGTAGKGAALGDRMEELGIPGLSQAVIHEGKTAWARGFGAADLESREPVTSDTLFLAGSISKPVAAVGALVLVERGVLSLDQDINQFLDSWQLPESETHGGHHVTLRQLLTHTGGLTVHGFHG